MFPHIQPNHRVLRFHNWRILVRQGSDFQLSCTIARQPCPTGSESRGCRGVELGLKFVKAAEGVDDRRRSHARNLVGRDRHADAGAAHQDAAIELAAKGTFDPALMQGAWAGEIGMVQMLPKDILEQGVDGDGDGLISLKTSAPDALLSAARMLQSLGWRAGEPWLQEVTLPEGLDWIKTGLETELAVSNWAAQGVTGRGADLPGGALPASVLLPQGRNGPAFLAFPNFRVLFEWNKSFVYVTTAAYFATRLEGAEVYDAGTPDEGLTQDQLIALQEKLAARGYDVGKFDGILGAATRRAVQMEQSRLGLPADAWPTSALLAAL